jgi:hypothetical protein
MCSDRTIITSLNNVASSACVPSVSEKTLKFTQPVIMHLLAGSGVTMFNY